MIVSGAEIVIEPGGSLELYVGGELLVDWGGGVNLDSADPTLLSVTMLGLDPVWLDTSGQLYGTILHPTGGLFVEAAHLYGTALASSIEVFWGGGIHMDERLVCP